MRVALILLFLLASPPIPGSVVPQSDINPLTVSDFRARNPALSEWYDRLGLFDVYSAPWFAAIYLALLISLVGCILPRSAQHWRAMRAQPPPAPRRLSRMPVYRRFETPPLPPRYSTPPAPSGCARFRAHGGVRQTRRRASKSDLWHASRHRSRSPPSVGHALHPEPNSTPRPRSHSATRRRVRRGTCARPATSSSTWPWWSCSSAVAVGSLFGYRATVLVAEGSGFANSVIQYDGLSSGALFDAGDLPPVLAGGGRVRHGVRRGRVATRDAATTSRRRYGSPPSPARPEQTRTIRVNEPLEVDGTMVHILNPGYAPAITVRDADGAVLAEGAVPFLPQDDNFTSTGVVKVQVAPDAGLGEDIGIQGMFLPTAVVDRPGPAVDLPRASQSGAVLHGVARRPRPRRRTAAVGLPARDVRHGAVPGGGRGGLPRSLGGGRNCAAPRGVREPDLRRLRHLGEPPDRAKRRQGVRARRGAAGLAGLVASMFVRRRRVWVRVVPGDGAVRWSRSRGCSGPRAEISMRRSTASSRGWYTGSSLRTRT